MPKNEAQKKLNDFRGVVNESLLGVCIRKD